ncbi:helix-turn-helix domain-containing protein [Klebsiella africana]|uniref:Helix-turn-helix transcriptional regulator n=1 Tax=Klebsiella africana TaxID=2489010 RepID=A0ACD4AV54_9ENTR|nr:helix-turn-helix transcriptional regulator [Klebsiella africana]USB43467.1 helix-turn-helix transcriptional regulator [Klebsiella africana]
MAIIVKLDILLAARKVKSKELADAIGITEQNLSLIKQGKIKGFRFSTLDALCKYLDCQPGDLFSYIPSKEDE